MKHIRNILIGFIIGGGMILPGVSGGVLAVIFGIYENMIDAFLTFFKNVKKNILFLGPIIIGVLIGAITFGKILFFLFDKYPMEAQFAFIGLIVGGIPSLVSEVKCSNIGKINIPLLITTLIISLSLFVLGKGTFNIDFSSNLNNGIMSFILLFITGFIFISGKIIPGISSSFMLMLIGMYQFLLNILNNPLGLSQNEYMQLIPFALGIATGLVSLLKLVQHLIKKYFSLTYSAIIGFVIGSISAIYPGITFNQHGLVSVILLIVGYICIRKFAITGQNEPKEQ